MYQQFIASLQVNDVINIAKVYFNIDFTHEELAPLLPYVQRHYGEFLDLNTREQFIETIRSMTTPSTFKKLMTLLDAIKNKSE